MHSTRASKPNGTGLIKFYHSNVLEMPTKNDSFNAKIGKETVNSIH